MRTPSDLPRRTPRTSRRFRIGVIIAIVVVIVLLSTARGLASFYVSYLWFQEVHFESVFRGVLLTKILLAVVFVALFFVLMLASLIVADRFAPTALDDSHSDELVERYRDLVAPRGRWVRLGVAAIFALFAGLGTNGQWNNWDLFRYSVPFPGTDPVFHKNIGFYVFQLPFIRFLLDWSFEAVIVILLVTAVSLYLNGGIRFQGSSPRVTAAVKTHLSVLLGVLAVIQAVHYYYDRFGLVLSTAHVVDGATNTDIHANLPAEDLLIVIAIIAAALFLVNTRVRGWTLPIVAVVVWAVVWVVAGNIYPALYQALRVNPSELSRETPYIERNIAATRAAYQLNGVKVASYNYDSAADQTLLPSDLEGNSTNAASNRTTLANVQVLDPIQLVNTFNNLQALRTFYSINSLSVGRYYLRVGDKKVLTETLTGVRELNTQVPNGFTNSRLIYTHGYGAAVAPATQEGVQANGDPNFSLSNVPPVGQPALSIGPGAQVYYGEGSQTTGFVIADSEQPEFDYPTGSNGSVSTHYAGNGGVPISNVFRRLAFALSFSNLDILLSGQITDKSRIIYNRNIIQRVRKAAPFLQYDAEPYSVIVGNQIYWIVDAYTTTANYPYSQDANTSRVASNSGLSGTFNYVRNSVKVVINAYDGKMDFFVVDPSDPIIQVYERAFPDLFLPASKADALIPGITSQFRYPEDLFEIQTNMYGRYHLTNPSQFYTQALAWDISQDPGSGEPGSGNTLYNTSSTGVETESIRQLNPEYEVAALPGATKQNFLMLQPFVPYSPSQNIQTLTGVMFATSDPNDFGDGPLTVYETPSGESVHGPELIASEIANTTDISSQFSLLDQHGSKVELGEVVIVPVADTLLYVQPVYVESSTNNVPELKSVIVVYNNNAYYSGNASLDAALCLIGSPFEQYCNTAAANRSSNVVSGTGSSSTSPSSTSSTSSTSTTTTTVPSGTTGTQPTAPLKGTVTELLAAATREFDAADAALKAGDLGTYQTDVKKAEAYVQQARAEAGDTTPSATTTTTVPRTTTTTTKKH